MNWRNIPVICIYVFCIELYVNFTINKQVYDNHHKEEFFKYLVLNNNKEYSLWSLKDIH